MPPKLSQLGSIYASTATAFAPMRHAKSFCTLNPAGSRANAISIVPNSCELKSSNNT